MREHNKARVIRTSKVLETILSDKEPIENKKILINISPNLLTFQPESPAKSRKHRKEESLERLEAIKNKYNTLDLSDIRISGRGSNSIKNLDEKNLPLKELFEEPKKKNGSAMRYYSKALKQEQTKLAAVSHSEQADSKHYPNTIEEMYYEREKNSLAEGFLSETPVARRLNAKLEAQTVDIQTHVKSPHLELTEGIKTFYCKPYTSCTDCQGTLLRCRKCLNARISNVLSRSLEAERDEQALIFTIAGTTAESNKAVSQKNTEERTNAEVKRAIDTAHTQQREPRKEEKSQNSHEKRMRIIEAINNRPISLSRQNFTLEVDNETEILLKKIKKIKRDAAANGSASEYSLQDFDRLLAVQNSAIVAEKDGDTKKCESPTQLQEPLEQAKSAMEGTMQSDLLRSTDNHLPASFPKLTRKIHKRELRAVIAQPSDNLGLAIKKPFITNVRSSAALEEELNNASVEDLLSCSNVLCNRRRAETDNTPTALGRTTQLFSAAQRARSRQMASSLLENSFNSDFPVFTRRSKTQLNTLHPGDSSSYRAEGEEDDSELHCVEGARHTLQGAIVLRRSGLKRRTVKQPPNLLNLAEEHLYLEEIENRPNQKIDAWQVHLSEFLDEEYSFEDCISNENETLEV